MWFYATPSISEQILICALLVFTCAKVSLSYEEENLVHVQSFEGQVGSGNFTYYRLTLDGFVVIRLHSVAGDADLYTSSSSLQPTWDMYELKSTTCGIDEIEIEPRQTRPIGIGVYGYIVKEVNSFFLSVYIDANYVEPYPEEDGTLKSSGETYSSHSGLNGRRAPQYEEEEEKESMLWTIFVSFLKILFDILI